MGLEKIVGKYALVLGILTGVSCTTTIERPYQTQNQRVILYLNYEPREIKERGDTIEIEGLRIYQTQEQKSEIERRDPYQKQEQGVEIHYKKKYKKIEKSVEKESGSKYIILK